MLAEKSDLREWIDKLFEGDLVNLSEHRAATHTALREKPNLLQLKNAIELINKKDYETIIHIGVGGSDLGPRLLYAALKDFYQRDVEVHFVSELDSDEMNDVLAKIDPNKTLFILNAAPRKCKSIALAPAKSCMKFSIPITRTMTKLTQDHNEKRPPTV